MAKDIRNREDEFKAQFMCSFKPNERMQDLRAKWRQYHIDTEDCNNQVAHVFRKELNSWIEMNGYTKEEFRSIKREGVDLHG